METLKIHSGVVRLNIEDEYGHSRGVFSFNPKDLEQMSRIYKLREEIGQKQTEIQQKAAKLETMDEKVDFIMEVVHYYRELIDKCFGEGTSDLVFGECNTLEMFGDFLDGITPYYEKANAERLAKYKKPKKSGK